MLNKEDIHALDAGVVIRSSESFEAPKLEPNLRPFKASWGPPGGLLGCSWGSFGDLGGSEAHFGAYTFKRMGYYFSLAGFGPPNGRQEAPKRPQEGPKWGQDGRQDWSKRAFERKTSKTSKLTTLSMKMLDLGGRGGSKICKFWSRNGFESKRSSN